MKARLFNNLLPFEAKLIPRFLSLAVIIFFLFSCSNLCNSVEVNHENLQKIVRHRLPANYKYSYEKGFQGDNFLYIHHTIDSADKDYYKSIYVFSKRNKIITTAHSACIDWELPTDINYVLCSEKNYHDSIPFQRKSEEIYIYYDSVAKTYMLYGYYISLNNSL